MNEMVSLDVNATHSWNAGLGVGEKAEEIGTRC